VEPTPSRKPMEPAFVHQDSPTTTESAPNAPPEPSGAQPPANASSSAVKTQSTQPHPTAASVWQATEFCQASANNAQTASSSATDTASPVQSTQPTTPTLLIVIAQLDSTPTNMESAPRNAELTKSTTPLP